MQKGYERLAERIDPRLRDAKNEQRAFLAKIDQGAEFWEGYELDEATAKLVPDTAIGRMLDSEEAAKLLQKIERQNPKQPPVKRRAPGRKRAQLNLGSLKIETASGKWPPLVGQ
ncbi:MAG TPA: hypothetical protein VGI22_02480 [Xanthobacteraceae bacterium]